MRLIVAEVSSLFVDCRAVFNQDFGNGVWARLQGDGSWWLNNSGIVSLDQGSLLIDTCATLARSESLFAEACTLTGAPVLHLVNTHPHGDHTNGNCLADNAEIYGHPNCTEQIMTVTKELAGIPFSPIDWGDITPVAPNVTVSQPMRLPCRGKVVELHPLGFPAHTDADLMVWLPEGRILFTGDLVFHRGTPFFLAGSLEGTRKSLAAIKSFAPALIVPGHGQPCTPEYLVEVERYLEFVERTAKEALKAGLSPLDAASRCSLGEWATYGEAERIVANLRVAYLELDPSSLSTEIPPVVSGFMDMIAYNGGKRLPTCA